jgi:TRAP-type C4-dicarboxylate transport system substrate-binding protein
VGNEAHAALKGKSSYNLASMSPVGSAVSQTMDYVSAEAKARTDGAMTIKYFPASQLGNDGEILTECVAGNIPLVQMITSSLVGTVPELAVFDMYCAISNPQT